MKVMEKVGPIDNNFPLFTPSTSYDEHELLLHFTLQEEEMDG
jgi:hypothetical protein